MQMVNLEREVLSIGLMVLVRCTETETYTLIKDLVREKRQTSLSHLKYQPEISKKLHMQESMKITRIIVLNIIHLNNYL